LAFGAYQIWRSAGERDRPPVTKSDDASASAPRDRVVLSKEKQRSAGTKTELTATRTLQAWQDVPGRLQYDDRRHVEVKTATAGIIVEIGVKTGDHVTSGQVLARISSPEVGEARADCLKRQAELALAQRQAKWEQAICDGLERLVAAVRDGRDPKSISADLTDVPVGSNRRAVLDAYTRFRLADALAKDTASVADAGVLAGRTIRERQSERDAAEAALQSVIEQSLFDARQSCTAAQIQADDAGYRLKISQQVLQTLLGYATQTASNEGDASSMVEVRAPLEGTIEEQMFSVSERVKGGDSLFTLADTTRLWAAADIRDRQWDALCLEPGQKLEVSAPAFPGQSFPAELYYVGRQVSPQTRAVPLVATLENPEGLLRPGQFIRMHIPMDEPRSVLAVPSSAIVMHEGESFVFVARPQNVFQRVDVKTGIAEDQWIEIQGGLDAGDAVVTAGAFLLKAELLLEKEEE
jgi:cobalt-zinc-cadmium efflux system membrane fusion protein